ncbi:MAG: alpha/beta fold hydrolase [Alphaproteobacteria bacterium]
MTEKLVVPEPNRTVPVTMSDGAVVLLRRHGNPAGPRIAFSHGNGLAIDGYWPYWRNFCADFDVVVFDVRNHGRNPLHTEAGHNWRQFVEDFELLYETIQVEFGRKRTAGAFHSLSSIIAIAQSLDRGPRWDPLILFDSPLFPPPGHRLMTLEEEDMADMAALARRRPDRYADPSILAGQFATGRNFQRWVKGAPELMARATLRRDDVAGNWTLACPKLYESQVFARNVDGLLWPRLHRLPIPTMVIGGDPNFELCPTPAVLCHAAAIEQGLAYARVPRTTHFLQIEEPEACYRLTVDFLRATGAVD